MRMFNPGLSSYFSSLSGFGSQPLDSTTDHKFVSKRGKKSTAILVSNSTGSEKSAVIYVGRIPHGFYEDQMRGIGLIISEFSDSFVRSLSSFLL